jgi:hypothetical protein
MSNPPAIAPKIQYFTHQNTFEQIAPFFPGLKKEDPTARAGRSRWCSCQRTTAPISDAPYHFHSTMNGKLGQRERATSIDEIPLEWCFQPGVKQFPPPAGCVVTAKDVEEELNAHWQPVAAARDRHDQHPRGIALWPERVFISAAFRTRCAAHPQAGRAVAIIDDALNAAPR